MNRDAEVTRVEVCRGPYGWRVVYWIADAIYDVIECDSWLVLRRIRGRVSCGFRLPTERQLAAAPSAARGDERVWGLERA